MRRVRSAWLISLVVLAVPAFGDITAFAPNGVSPFFQDNPVSLGQVFTPTSQITVTALGYYYFIAESTPEEVGLYDSAGNILASTVVVPTLGTDGYNFGAITAVPLIVGEVYTVESSNPAGYGYSYAAPVLAAPGITLGETVFAYGPKLQYTTANFSKVQAYYGPDFEFTSSTPEPSFYGMLALGIGGLLAAKRALQR